MKIYRSVLCCALAALSPLVMGAYAIAQDAPAAGAQVLDYDEIPDVAPAAPSVDDMNFDERHEACLESISDDPETAFEDAMIWQSRGGGRRARHCAALALFAAGETGMAAAQLEQMGSESRIGPAQMRAEFYAQAADFWLVGQDPRAAYRAANSGLEIAKSDTDLRIIRARAYAKLGRWDYAEIDLTSTLAYDPVNVQALIYRADARRRQGKLEDGLADAERALALDELSVEAAVVRGDIREEMRLAKIQGEASIQRPQSETQ